MCVLTIEASEIKAAVKNPKAFIKDLQDKHVPALLEVRVRPKLETHEAYLEVTRTLDIHVEPH